MILLQPYIINMFLTNALIQKVRTTVKNQVFGDPDKNVTYVPKLVDILEAAGHDFNIYTKTPIDVKKRLLAVVLNQKMNSLKKENKMMLKAEKLQYLDKWRKPIWKCWKMLGSEETVVQKELVPVEFSYPSQLQRMKCHCFRLYTRQMPHT
jgi:hypothetical protein